MHDRDGPVARMQINFPAYAFITKYNWSLTCEVHTGLFSITHTGAGVSPYSRCVGERLMHFNTHVMIVM